MPERFVAESLVEALAELPGPAGADRTRARRRATCSPRRCASAAPRSTCSTLYETVAEPLSEPALEAARAADYITFTSSSTVRFFLQAAGERPAPPGTRIVSIGPVTSETLREHGLEPDVEAERHDIDGRDRRDRSPTPRA